MKIFENYDEKELCDNCNNEEEVDICIGPDCVETVDIGEVETPYDENLYDTNELDDFEDDYTMYDEFDTFDNCDERCIEDIYSELCELRDEIAELKELILRCTNL